MSAPPLLVCLDLQQAFLADGSLWAPRGSEALLECGRLLALARRRRWSIAHCYLRGGTLGVAGAEALPISGFAPRSHEAVFERSTLSAYGHRTFAGAVERAPHRCALIAGLSASVTFMATAFDAFEHGHRLVIAANALAAQTGSEASAEHHKAVAGDVAQLLGFALAPSRNGRIELEAMAGADTWRGLGNE